LYPRFSTEFNVVSHPTQSCADGKNIFIFTPERVVSYSESKHFPKIDFFVFDEFYKLSGQNEEDTRVPALNEAFYILYKRHRAQFYMLGPCVQKIFEGVEGNLKYEFVQTNFQTVYSEIIVFRLPMRKNANRNYWKSAKV
jgi:hypothetical protein